MRRVFEGKTGEERLSFRRRARLDRSCGNFARAAQGQLGHHRADELINQRAREHHGLDAAAVGGKARKRQLRHADGYTRLGNQREAQVFCTLG